MEASAIVGLGVIAGGVLGGVFAAPCDGQTVLCGSTWGAARGTAWGSGLAALTGAVLYTMDTGISRRGAMYTALGGLGVMGAALVAGAVRRMAGG